MKKKISILILSLVCLGGGYLCQQPVLIDKSATFVSWDWDQSSTVLKEYPGKALKERLALFGYDLSTTHVYPPETSDLVLNASKFYNFPEKIKGKAFLWLLESPISIKVPAKKQEEKKYVKIFTWNPDLDGREKYVYIPIPYKYKPFDITVDDIQQKDILLAQVAGSHGTKQSTYQARRDDTEWMLKNAPNDYRFAGTGEWNEFKKQLSDDLKKQFDKQYAGVIDNKKAFLKKAKFGLAYENAQATGYVTEKIYDMMAAGTVPVYLGAPDIENHVPKACFINRADFKTMDDLYAFLKNMSDTEYMKYMDCIFAFMKNGANQANEVNRVMETITNEMLKEINS